MDILVLILADIASSAVPAIMPLLRTLLLQAKIRFRTGPAQEHATR
jgi:hypothetical protein